MKKLTIRIISLSLVVIMLAAAICSCGTKSMKVKVGIKLGQDYIDYKYAEAKRDGNDEFIIPKGDRTILNDVEVKINYTDDDPVTVLRVLSEAAANNSFEYKTNASEQSVDTIRSYSSFLYTPDANKPIEGFAETLAFFWSFTVNGEEPDKRINNCLVKDGDVIVFTLTSQGIEEE